MATLTGSFTRLDIADALRCEIDGDTVRVLSTTAPHAVDVAQVERAIAELTRQRDGALGLSLATAVERDHRTSALSVAERRCASLTAEADSLARELADLRAAVIAAAGGVAPDVSRYGHHVGVALGRTAQLHREAAHRAAGEGVDLAAAVRHEAHCMEWIARVTESPVIRGALSDRAERLRSVLARHGHVSGQGVESGAQEAVEGGGHGASVDPATVASKSQAS